MDLEARLQLLRQIPYFRALPIARVRELAAAVRVRHYNRGEVIFRKGDESEGLCIVLRGGVRTVLNSPDGRQQILKRFGPGRTFGDVSVFDNDRQPAEAVAIADSEITVIPRAELLDILRSNPDAAIEVIGLFASRLRAYKQFVEDLALRPVISRVARLLVDRARGAPTLVEEPQSLDDPYTQDEIASMVGSVREVVQRALKTLERAELIEMTRGRIQVIDVEALDAWTEGGIRLSRNERLSDQDRDRSNTNAPRSMAE
jgi:CRP/FNR family cyclic AMP-dependent transcriptional regulator